MDGDGVGADEDGLEVGVVVGGADGLGVVFKAFGDDDYYACGIDSVFEFDE